GEDWMEAYDAHAQHDRKKKPYSTPRLTAYGDLQKLTRGIDCNGFDGTSSQTKNGPSPCS
ncbi:MAG TPA: lasso RiPP family leader peptide-containing protein, partial [Terriglobales bacterium]|nr:lasso RiPP family leader peptide-containing protein [Terriglobales bacterium]